MIDYPKYKKVLFCTDFSENCDIAFGYAFGIAKRDGGDLYILHVMPSPNNYPNYVENYLGRKEWDKIEENNRKEIDKTIQEKYLNQVKDKSTVHVVVKAGREDEEIINFANKEKIDIIIIGTQGRSGILHAFLGSVAEKVVRRSLVPVFVIPCKKRRMYDKS
jgi:nucleotide-binding universal stress UspA family protein